jgi:effector-binding domain-containing protein
MSMTETISYEITGQIGEIEFRKYPPIVLATVQSPAADSGFNLLFSYITGNNRTKGQIPMTAPVITSAQIPMTAPVVSDGQTMSFVMPCGKEKEEMPEPLDHRVKITSLPGRELAVIRFKGYAGPEDSKEPTSRLLEGLKKSGIITQGQPVLMRYNAPWTPGFLRRNEIGIEIIR